MGGLGLTLTPTDILVDGYIDRWMDRYMDLWTDGNVNIYRRCVHKGDTSTHEDGNRVQSALQPLVSR